MSGILRSLNDSPEWYTPPEIIQLVRRVMGRIDLDPASSDEANRTVGASTYYTKEDDGLNRVWMGRVFLNPPYGSGNQAAWSRKLEQEYLKRNTIQAILLVNANLGYDWFNHLLYTYPTCLIKERLSFIPGSGQKATVSRRASALVYFGPNLALFTVVASRLGIVIIKERPSY